MTHRSQIVAKLVITALTLAALVVFDVMIVAGWVLLPLHWWAATRNGIYGTVGWGLLAGASAFALVWTLVDALADNTTVAAVLATLGALVVFAVWLLRGARRWVFDRSVIE